MEETKINIPEGCRITSVNLVENMIQIYFEAFESERKPELFKKGDWIYWETKDCLCIAIVDKHIPEEEYIYDTHSYSVYKNNSRAFHSSQGKLPLTLISPKKATVEQILSVLIPYAKHLGYKDGVKHSFHADSAFTIFDTNWSFQNDILFNSSVIVAHFKDDNWSPIRKKKPAWAEFAKKAGFDCQNYDISIFSQSQLFTIAITIMFLIKDDSTSGCTEIYPIYRTKQKIWDTYCTPNADNINSIFCFNDRQDCMKFIDICGTEFLNKLYNIQL